jgi:3-oxoacyl-[acyl-carrier protein] reductase
VAREQLSWRDITEESIDHVLDVDIKGTLLCTHEFGTRMLSRRTSNFIWNEPLRSGPRKMSLILF